jgi:aminoglycoside 6'-N-acetyltransferase
LRVLAKLGFREGPWFDEPGPHGRVDTVVGCALDVTQVMGVNDATEQ